MVTDICINTALIILVKITGCMVVMGRGISRNLILPNHSLTFLGKAKQCIFDT